MKYILIDDDQLIHQMWKMDAKSKGLELGTFFSVDEFIKVADSVDKMVEIYIDSSLGDGLLGEVESEKIYNRGFKELFLATGKSPQDIEKPSWIREIVGKRPPFGA